MSRSRVFVGLVCGLSRCCVTTITGGGGGSSVSLFLWTRTKSRMLPHTCVHTHTHAHNKVLSLFNQLYPKTEIRLWNIFLCLSLATVRKCEANKRHMNMRMSAPTVYAILCHFKVSDILHVYNIYSLCIFFLYGWLKDSFSVWAVLFQIL